MKRDKLKTPYDYEIFSFRATKDQKENLNSLIDAVVDLYNRKKSKDEKKYRKNDVIMEALEKGLEVMRRGKAK